MRKGMLVVGTIVALIEVAGADSRPRLEEFATTAPAWAKDCTVDVVTLGESSFSVAVACRGSEELAFERRAKSPRIANGTVTTFDGMTRVHAWRGTKYSTDVYACSSPAERDGASRCKALIDAFAQSTIVRRGAAAFARPKS